MRACVRSSVRIYQGHNSYVYVWISKLFDTVFDLEEEKFHLKYFFLSRLKVKVTLEGHINKLVQALTPTFMQRLQNKLAQFISFMSSSVIYNICSGRWKVKVTLEG